jgi:hypothetical protein
LGLLAYESPLDSPLAHLLNQDHRNLTAEIINQEIIGNFILFFNDFRISWGRKEIKFRNCILFIARNLQGNEIIQKINLFH